MQFCSRVSVRVSACICVCVRVSVYVYLYVCACIHVIASVSMCVGTLTYTVYTYMPEYVCNILCIHVSKCTLHILHPAARLLKRSLLERCLLIHGNDGIQIGTM
jgi:hypothetical protein